MIRANRQGLLRTVGNRVLPDLFALYRKISPVRERVKIGEFNDRVEREHLVRYRFAQAYCRDKTVADIACGTGYGSEILREVARSVDGYDKEDLCQNFILDLETDCWERAYDVIVSFETIEHLADCDIFLENLWKTAGTVVISSPVGEFMGYNPHHKQVWTLDEFEQRLERWFTCEYFFQQGESIQPRTEKDKVRFIIAVCKPRRISARSTVE